MIVAALGAEPASCCTLGGIRKLRELGHMDSGADVLGILTGHLLKDPDANLFVHTELDSRQSSAPIKVSAEPQDNSRSHFKSFGRLIFSWRNFED